MEPKKSLESYRMSQKGLRMSLNVVTISVKGQRMSLNVAARNPNETRLIESVL